MNGFGNRLKEAREACKLTQRELAIMCETDEAIIRGYEKERRSPSKSMMIRLFNALKMTPDFFFQDELSFYPYQDREGLLADIEKLMPDQYALVKIIVETLKKQNRKN